ncbi:putative disease resistance protein RGA4 [Neltuma alba]|uniref:putative disease resistance protein RGA4 n=1 Tax=Neltuma alba TaxID=207710 RepID=UPI0010A4FBC1|nr:putative disease resistance protein RGA4 [Prosopis alba]
MTWLGVSDESHALSNNMLAQKIIEQETPAKAHQAARELRHTIEGKLFQLVLDDVWNIKDRGEWLKLENLFRAGRKGSMIVVTTSSMEVAETMGTHLPLSLKDLHKGNSWELFCRVVFGNGKEPYDHKLVGMGKDIVRKCAGVPLAIRTIELPSDLKRLVRLRHLKLDYCESLICMPSGSGCLINLQTRTTFVVDEVSGSGGARISELHDLICLRRHLEITNLRRQWRNVKEIESS